MGSDPTSHHHRPRILRFEGVQQAAQFNTRVVMECNECHE
jgi:hypothetical protein